jgi:hypothetical protein
MANFIAVRDEWSIYKLKNGTVIKSKYSLANVEIDSKSKMLSLKFAQANLVIPVDDDKSPPGADAIVQDVDLLNSVPFDVVQEIINIYDIPESKQILLVRPHVDEVVKTRKFDQSGTRLYQLNLHLAVGSVAYPPEKLLPGQAEMFSIQ